MPPKKRKENEESSEQVQKRSKLENIETDPEAHTVLNEAVKDETDEKIPQSDTWGTLLICGGTNWDLIGRKEAQKNSGNSGGPNLWEPHTMSSLKGVHIRHVASGPSACHSIVVTEDGTAMSFGRNDKGQLGHNNMDKCCIPKVIESLKNHTVVQASCGKNHSLVLTGHLYPGVQRTENCTQSGRDSSKHSFSFLQLGNSSSLKQCLSSCCGNGLCELAIRSGTNCYGVSCKRLGVCHQILDELVRGADKARGKSSFIDHAVTKSTVELADLHCPQRIIPTFAILLQQSRPVHGFVKLHGEPTSPEDCKRRCCELSDCEISFTENQLCYGLVCGGGSTCRTRSFPRQEIHLQLAIIERNREVTRSLDDTDEADEDFDLGSDASDKRVADATQEAFRSLHMAESSRNSKSPTRTNKHKAHASSKSEIRVKLKGSTQARRESVKEKNEIVVTKRQHTKHASHKTTSQTTSIKIQTKTRSKKRQLHAKVLLKHSEKHSAEKSSATTKSAIPSFLFTSVKPVESTSRTSDSHVTNNSKMKVPKKGSVKGKEYTRRVNRKKASIPSFLFTYRPKQDKGNAKSKSRSVLQNRGQTPSHKPRLPPFLFLLHSPKNREGMEDQPLKRSKVQSSQIHSNSFEDADTKPRLPSFLFSLRSPETKTQKSDGKKAKSRSLARSDTTELSKKSTVSSVKKSIAKKGDSNAEATDKSGAPAFLFLSKKSQKPKSSETNKKSIRAHKAKSKNLQKTNLPDQKPPPFLLSLDDTKTVSSNNIKKIEQKNKHYAKKHFVPLELSETNENGSGGDDDVDDSGSSEYEELLMPKVESSGQESSAAGSDLMFRAQESKANDLEASTTHKHVAHYSGEGPSGDDLNLMLDVDGSGVGDIHDGRVLTSGSGMGGESGSTGDLMSMDPRVANEGERSGDENAAKRDQTKQKTHVPEEIRNKSILELRPSHDGGHHSTSNRHPTLSKAKGNVKIANVKGNAKARVAAQAYKIGPKGQINTSEKYASHRAAVHTISNLRGNKKAASRLRNFYREGRKHTEDKQSDDHVNGRRGRHVHAKRVKSIGNDLTKTQDQKKKAKKRKKDLIDLMRRAHIQKVHNTMKPKKIKHADRVLNHGHILKKLIRESVRESKVIRPRVHHNKTSLVSVNVKAQHPARAVSEQVSSKDKLNKTGGIKASVLDIPTLPKYENATDGLQKKTISSRSSLSVADSGGSSNSLLSHFLNDSDSRNGLAFSVKSSKKHKGSHRKKEIQIDADDLGDADFDIMMSNDIPHEDIPTVEKKKTKHKEAHKHKHKHAEKKTKLKGHKTKKDSKPYIILGEDARDDDDDDDKDIIRGIVKFTGGRNGNGGREGTRKPHRHPEPNTKISSDNENHENHEKKREHAQQTEQEESSEETEHDNDHHRHHHSKKIHIVSGESHDDDAETGDTEDENRHVVYHNDYDSEKSETDNNRYEHSLTPKVRHRHRHFRHYIHQHRNKKEDGYERQDSKPEERERKKQEWDGEHQEEEDKNHHSHGDHEQFSHHIAHEEHHANDEEHHERNHEERARHHEVRFRHENSERHENEQEDNRRRQHHHRFHDKENPYWPQDERKREHESHEPYKPHVLHEPHEPHVSHEPYEPHAPHESQVSHEPHVSLEPHESHVSREPQEPHVSHEPYESHVSHESYEPHVSHEKPVRHRVFLGEDTEKTSWKHHEYHKQEDGREHGWKEPDRHGHSDEDHNDQGEEYHRNDPDTVVDSQHNQYHNSGHEFKETGTDKAEEVQRYHEERIHHVESEQPDGKNENQEKWEEHEKQYNGENQAHSDETQHNRPPERPYETHHNLSEENWNEMRPHEESREKGHEAESHDHQMPYEKTNENRFEKFSSTHSNPTFEHEAYPHLQGENGRELEDHLQRDGWRQHEQPNMFGFRENIENGPQYRHHEHRVDVNDQKFEGDNALRKGFEGNQNPLERTENPHHYPWETVHHYDGADKGQYVDRNGRPPDPPAGPFDNTKEENNFWQNNAEHNEMLNPQWGYNQDENYDRYYHSGNPDNPHQPPRPPWPDWSGNSWQNEAWGPPVNWQSGPVHTNKNTPWSRPNGNPWPNVGQNGAPTPRAWPNQNKQFHNNNVVNISQANPTRAMVHSSPPPQNQITHPGKAEVDQSPSVSRPATQPKRNQAPTPAPNSNQGSIKNKTIQQPPPLKSSPAQNQGALPTASNNANSKMNQSTLKQKSASTAPSRTTGRLTTTVQSTKPRTPANIVHNQSSARNMDAHVLPTKSVGQKHGGPADNKGRQKPDENTISVNRLNGFFNDENKKPPLPQDGKKSTGKPEQHPQLHSPTESSSSIRPKAHAPLKASDHVIPTQQTHATIRSSRGPIRAGHARVKPAYEPTRTFGEETPPDDITEEKGSKHRKHRAPLCHADEVHEDTTLARGRRAGNFTKIGDVGDFEMCIKRCCQHKLCDVAYKSAETCFLVHCFSKESCETAASLTDFFNPKLCFVRRHSKEDEEDEDFPNQDQDQSRNDDDKISPSGIREVCETEKALGILWRKTAAGGTSSRPCPRKATGDVRRRCEADSRWLPPDFSNCVSSDYRVLYDKSKKLADGADPSHLIRELSQLTTQNIDNSLILGGDLMKSQEIMAAIVQNNGQTDLLDMTRDDLEGFVKAGSNLLDLTNEQGWYSIQKRRPGSADVLRAIEMFALQAAMRLPQHDMNEPIIFNNILIKIDRKPTRDGVLSFPDYTDSRIKRWDVRHDIVSLPPSAFKRGEVSVASISFKSLPYLLPDVNSSSGLGPNSKVISTIVHPEPPQVISPPVTIVLSHIKPKRGNPKCVFWDYTIKPHRGGGWSPRGCWLAHNNDTHSVCQCSHLSNFAVLMDMSSDEVSEKEQKRERTMALMWIGIPVLIVGIIGALYMSFTWNRKPGVPSTAARQTLNEKTGLLGQRVVTSQIKEQYPPSPTRDLYRALSPAYSATAHDLEWQDEFQLAVGCEPDDSGFKKILMPHLKMLQRRLTQEFREIDKADAKRIFLVNKDAGQDFPRKEFNTESDTQLDSPGSSCSGSIVSAESSDEAASERTSEPDTCDIPQNHPRTIPLRRQKLRVTFAEDTLPFPNRTGLERERFERLQRMERRVFHQNLRRWQQMSELNNLPQ